VFEFDCIVGSAGALLLVFCADAEGRSAQTKITATNRIKRPTVLLAMLLLLFMVSVILR
jgi:hypothetical protein